MRRDRHRCTRGTAYPISFFKPLRPRTRAPVCGSQRAMRANCDSLADALAIMSHTKEEIRERVWHALEEARVHRFPGTRGRIPNFVGAERAADRLCELDVWKRAQVLKCNPDAPQRPVRLRALKEGKIVYMAVPRLRELKCFIELDPSRLQKNITQASSIEGASRFGRPVLPEDMRKIDLIVCGTVAVNPDGARIGKGGGYSDLEYGLAREAGLVG